MNIREQLKQENSRRNADKIESVVVDNEDKLVELMVCFLSEEPLIVQRAAMVVGNVGRHKPELLRPWWTDLVQLLATSAQPSVRRSITRYFSEVPLPLPLPKKLETKLIDQCLGFVSDPKEKIATAVFAMQFIADRAEEFPQQATKLKQVLFKMLPTGSAGFRSRGSKVLVQLETANV